ncbi:unnamed protein product [Ectocarpus sp. 6 AP-2014]
MIIMNVIIFNRFGRYSTWCKSNKIKTYGRWWWRVFVSFKETNNRNTIPTAVRVALCSIEAARRQ